MALQIRSDYVNPLTMLTDKKGSFKQGQFAARQGGQTDEAAELQNKKQQLQMQMLLLKATGTDSTGAAEETRKAVEEELEKVAAKLQDVKRNGAQTVKQMEESQLDSRFAITRRSRDLYES